MKKTLFFLIFLALCLCLNANGVAIVDAPSKTVLSLSSSIVEVEVNQQVAIVTTSQTFINTTGDSTRVKYGFPLPADASATRLRWKVNGIWYNAVFNAAPQDTTLPGGGGGGGNQALVNYQSSNIPASANYRVEYELNSSQPGLFSFSTYLPDSMSICDSLGKGFFAFIAEPEPDTTQVINKVFTLIIDRSGSMAGVKMQQAKDEEVAKQSGKIEIY